MSRICVDSSDFRVNSSGELQLIPCQTGLTQRVIFRTVGADTFNKADYPGLCRVFVQVQGAGGGSAGANASTGNLIARPGGAGGAYAESLISASSLGTSVAVSVGAGGAAGTATAPGGTGGTSSFGGSVVAPGGDGGTAFMNDNNALDTTGGVDGASATGATGNLVSGGGSSEGAIRLTGSQGTSGRGGDSRLGFGGTGHSTESDGSTSRGRGAGAGGALSFGGATQGAVGGDGIVIVWLYF